MPKATRYYTADGYYLPGANAPELLARKERLFERLNKVYDDLEALGGAHMKTGYGCMQSGKCCQVGLVLHNLELEHMAKQLRAHWQENPSASTEILGKLEERLHDDEWTMEDGIGDLMCTFYKEGCTVYPFRPAVCRMYGTILELNDDCPRKRLSSGREFIWIRPEADAVVRRLYRAVDDYGAMFPRADCSRYMPAGLLMFLLPRKEWEKVKARTRPKYWQTMHGYRSQYVTSTKNEPYEEKVPRFPVALNLHATAGR